MRVEVGDIREEAFGKREKRHSRRDKERYFGQA
jgi:hypothetical protein